MDKTSNQIKQNQITTDDLAFSAYLRLQGYQLIKSINNRIKNSFVFDIGSDDIPNLKLNFINSKYLNYYNELRNLKKTIMIDEVKTRLIASLHFDIIKGG